MGFVCWGWGVVLGVSCLLFGREFTRMRANFFGYKKVNFVCMMYLLTWVGVRG